MPEPTVTLPVAFLSMMHYEDCRIGRKSLRDGTSWWFEADFDGCYTVPVRPAEPDEIEANNLMLDAIDALVAEPWHGHHPSETS